MKPLSRSDEEEKDEQSQVFVAEEETGSEFIPQMEVPAASEGYTSKTEVDYHTGSDAGELFKEAVDS